MVDKTIATGVELKISQERRVETAVPSDEQLALGVQKGDRHDLTLLVRRYHGPLFAYLYRLTGSERSLAEDLVQETFLRTLCAIGQYRHPHPFKPWIYAIATNLARDHYKRADTRYMEVVSGDELEAWQNTSPLPDDVFVAREEARHVAAVLALLPEHHREAVILRYYQDLSLSEMSAALRIPIGTVKSRLSLGLKRLKELIEMEE